MKKIAFIIILFFTATILEAQEVIKFNSNAVSYNTLNKETKKWKEWSDWIPSDFLILFNLNNLRLKFFNREKNGEEMSIDIVKIIQKEFNEKIQSTTIKFKGIDDNGKEVIVEFITKSDLKNSFQLYLGSGPSLVGFSLKNLD